MKQINLYFKTRNEAFAFVKYLHDLVWNFREFTRNNIYFYTYESNIKIKDSFPKDSNPKWTNLESVKTKRKGFIFWKKYVVTIKERRNLNEENNNNS